MNMLIATSISVSVLAVVAQQYATQRVELFRQSMGTAQGQQLNALGVATNAYVAQNFRTLVGQTVGILGANGAACTVASQLNPTVTELKTCGYLTQNFNATNYFSGGYQVNLSQSGTCPNNCTIIGTAALTVAILRNNAVDTSVLGAAMQAIGADSGFAKSGAGATIIGQHAGWNTANPIAGQPAGVLAMRVGTQSALYNTYYARDGRQPLTAALQMGGNQVTGLFAAVAGTTACSNRGDIAQDSTTGAPVYCDGAKYQAISGTAAGNWAATFASLPACNAGSKGQVYVVMTPTAGSGIRGYSCDGVASWQALGVDDSGNLTITGTATIAKLAGALEVAQYAKSGETCNLVWNSSFTIQTNLGTARPSNSLAVDPNNLILTCQSGVWRKATGSGTTGLAAPLAGKSISCSTGSPIPGWGSGGVSVDANGNFTLTACCQNGCASATNVRSVSKYCGNPYSSNAQTTLDFLGIGVSFSDAYSNNGACNATWPAT